MWVCPNNPPTKTKPFPISQLRFILKLLSLWIYTVIIRLKIGSEIINRSYWLVTYWKCSTHVNIHWRQEPRRGFSDGKWKKNSGGYLAVTSLWLEQCAWWNDEARKNYRLWAVKERLSMWKVWNYGSVLWFWLPLRGRVRDRGKFFCWDRRILSWFIIVTEILMATAWIKVSNNKSPLQLCEHQDGDGSNLHHDSYSNWINMIHVNKKEHNKWCFTWLKFGEFPPQNIW